MVTYTPAEAGARSYEVELHPSGGEGEVTLYVGGMPILYLDPVGRCVRLVPNDIGEKNGLVYSDGDCVHVVRDRTR